MEPQLTKVCHQRGASLPHGQLSRLLPGYDHAEVALCLRETTSKHSTRAIAFHQSHSLFFKGLISTKRFKYLTSTLYDRRSFVSRFYRLALGFDRLALVSFGWMKNYAFADIPPADSARESARARMSRSIGLPRPSAAAVHALETIPGYTGHIVGKTTGETAGMTPRTSVFRAAQSLGAGDTSSRTSSQGQQLASNRGPALTRESATSNATASNLMDFRKYYWSDYRKMTYSTLVSHAPWSSNKYIERKGSYKSAHPDQGIIRSHDSSPGVLYAGKFQWNPEKLM